MLLKIGRPRDAEALLNKVKSIWVNEWKWNDKDPILGLGIYYEGMCQSDLANGLNRYIISASRSTEGRKGLLMRVLAVQELGLGPSHCEASETREQLAHLEAEDDT